MITLKKSQIDQASEFARMEMDSDTSGFVFGYDENRHREEIQKEDVLYLSILEDDALVGFFILAIEPDRETVEFRRIVVDKKGSGIGQTAISEMEKFCKDDLGRSKIWLDVLESNERGIYIYKKLGYQEFKKGEQEAKALLFMSKGLLE